MIIMSIAYPIPLYPSGCHTLANSSTGINIRADIETWSRLDRDAVGVRTDGNAFPSHQFASIQIGLDPGGRGTGAVIYNPSGEVRDQFTHIAHIFLMKARREHSS